MDVRALGHLDPAQESAVRDLVARREAADQHPALSEDLRDGSGRLDLAHYRARALLAEEGGALVGCATLAPGADGFLALHVAVDPGAPSELDVRAALVRAALGQAAPGQAALDQAAPGQAAPRVRLWIMQAGPDDDKAVEALGFRPERDLLQMRVPLPLPVDAVAATRPVQTRPFQPGRDDDMWLSVNNRAFAGHPEQGNWTLEKLHDRERAEWFDPDGFLVAPAPDGRGLIGSCWTKVHRRFAPPLGEIYVISVDPSRHGEGWGRALTVAGLQWLSAQGLRVGMLYTDAANAAAVALYRSLGFSVDHVDRSYVTSP
ncbi:MAG: mycothiol synthase [Acidimicrobiales bacterium]